MEQKAFIELVERLEIYSREHPSRYRFRVGLLAALGYIYLFSVVTGLLLIIVGALIYVSFNFLVLKFLWIPLSLAAVVLRSLWIKMPEPDGHELTPSESPQLFEMIEEVRLTVSGPSVNKVQNYSRCSSTGMPLTSALTLSCWLAHVSTKPIAVRSRLWERRMLHGHWLNSKLRIGH